ncbi:MerR family transcriptional regulator [Ruminiclostridium cellulolyticum]|uniref:Regulatory protein, MerR n=1 Tax=Ruminiclostridium cellulolyticum (strain ATCC 35319 / DSM 5812 / JCM 6584 / H10) TaxID=394503 RepID=B8I1K0_RUMCH|nr:MerR family transcriptional regulator [Ruminiclostridium cellulolyticum]ACL77635.1 regulatory protein, MerR [Ruminiclostridium cellulolyticum H10]
MAEPKRCKECNGIFQYVTSKQLCLSCSQKDEFEFRRIKEFLKDNPKSSVSMVASSLDISVSHIQKFIDEGRLEIVVK